MVGWGGQGSDLLCLKMDSPPIMPEVDIRIGQIFLFQGMFAATAATIVSGAVAERIKISGYLSDLPCSMLA